MIHSKITGCMLALCMSSACLADFQVLLDSDQTNFKDTLVDTSPSSLSLGFGYRFNQRFTLIGKYGTGGKSDTAIMATSGVADFEIDSLAGIYFNTYLFKRSSFRPYATLGYTSTTLIANLEGQTLEQSEDGFSYGAGLEYKINRSFSTYLEYLSLINNSDAEMNTANLGFAYSW